MEKLLLSLVFSYLIIQIQGLPRVPIKKPHVVGGNAAPLGSVPYLVSLLSGGVNGPYVGCGGSILNENYILTAAHCAVAAKSFGVRAGFNSLYNPEEGFQTIPVSQIIIHEFYDRWTFANDIALLRLASPLVLNPGVRASTIKLPPSGYVTSGDVTVSGWGYLKEGSGILSNKLQSVTVPTVPDADCRLAYGDEEILDSMLCAGITSGGKDSCQGDSGGPLVEKSSGLLVGIVSFGNGCANPGYPGIYTETAYFADWIAKNINQIE